MNTPSTISKQRQSQKRIAMLVGIFVAVFALLAIASALTRGPSLTITAISPEEGRLPSSSTKIDVVFSDKLASNENQPKDFVKLSQDVQFSTSTNDKTLTIVFVERPQQDTELTIELSDVRAENNGSLSRTLSYTVVYIPYDELSEEERTAQAENQAGVDEDRPSILDLLPYDETAFRVSAFSTDENEDGFRIIITTRAIRNGVAQKDFEATTDRMRARAIEWIKQTGADPSTLEIIYSPDDADIDEGEFRGEEGEFRGDGETPDASFFEP